MRVSTLTAGWAFALIAAFIAYLLGEERLYGALGGFVLVWVVFTMAHYADKTSKERDRRGRIEYERIFGPHPSRRTPGEENLGLEAWLKTENGRNWSKFPQAREFLTRCADLVHEK